MTYPYWGIGKERQKKELEVPWWKTFWWDLARTPTKEREEWYREQWLKEQGITIPEPKKKEGLYEWEKGYELKPTTGKETPLQLPMLPEKYEKPQTAVQKAMGRMTPEELAQFPPAYATPSTRGETLAVETLGLSAIPMPLGTAARFVAFPLGKRILAKPLEQAVAGPLTRMVAAPPAKGVVKTATEEVVERAVTPAVKEVLKPFTTKAGKGYRVMRGDKPVAWIDYNSTEPLGVSGIKINEMNVPLAEQRRGLGTQIVEATLSDAEAEGKPLFSGALKPAGAKLLEGMEEKGLIKLTPHEQKGLGWVIERVKPPEPPVQPTGISADVVREREGVVTKIQELLAGRKPAMVSAEVEKKLTRQIKAREMTFAEAGAEKELIPRLSKVRAAQRGKEFFRPEYEPVSKEALSKREQALFLDYIDNHPLLFDDIHKRTNLTDVIVNKLLGWGKVKGGTTPTKGEYKLLEQVFGYDFAEAVKKHGFGTKITRIVTDALGVPKAVKAFLDFSFSLRQTVWYAVGGKPTVWGKEFVKQIRAVRGKNYEQFAAEIKGHPEFNHAVQHGMEFTERGGAKTLTTAEEAMPTRFTQYIPGMRQSEQAALTISNGCRFHTYYDARATYGDLLPDEYWTQFAKLLMAGSGRGTVPKGSKAFIALANRAFFSPRFHLGLAQMVYYPLVYIKNPLVRKFALRSWTGFLGLNAAIAGTGMATGLWDVELDPTSADFGRARIGDMRLDLLSGYRSWFVGMSRIATGELKTADGRKAEMNRWDSLLNLLEGKLDPVTGGVVSMLRGKTYLGEDLLPSKELSVGEWARRDFAPLAINDTIEAYEIDKLRGALAGGATALFGGNVASYPSRTFDRWADWVAETTGKNWDVDSLYSVRSEFNNDNKEWVEFDEMVGEDARAAWREDHPDVEAKMYFWGAIGTLSTGEAARKFKELLEAHGMSEFSFPVENVWQPYDASSEKPVDTFNRLLDEVPSYMSDQMKMEKDRWLEEDLAYLIDYWRDVRAKDDKLMRKYEIDMLEVPEEERRQARMAYRQLHPDIAAARALWGDITSINSLSPRAVEILKQRAIELGIPFELIPALEPKGGGKAAPLPKIPSISGGIPVPGTKSSSGTTMPVPK